MSYVLCRPAVPRLASVPEFTSPGSRPPRPHGQPSAVSSLHSALDESGGPFQPPAATSTQAEQPATPTAGANSQDSSGSHVTGSSASPEVVLQSAAVPARELTDQEEEELSEREQGELARRPLQPGEWIPLEGGGRAACI